VDVRVDEPRHHRDRTEVAIYWTGRRPAPDSGDDAVGDVNPPGPQQLSAGQQGVGGQ
jgi:hypothetical protein